MAHSFDQSIKRLGFCCKYLDPDQSKSKKLLEESQRPLNTRGTTISWLKNNPASARDKIIELSRHNAKSFYNIVKYVGSLPENLRMVRLSSDCLPVFTERTFSHYYRDPGIRRILENELSKVGQLAKKLDVRISFHPGQFVVLASDKSDVVDRSIEELEYHTLLAEWMGYAQKDFDMKINVHLSGKRQAEGFLEILPRLSEATRRVLTLENDEYQAGIDDLLPLAEHVGIVLDIHHHLIHDNEYIQADDERIEVIKDSWRGVRPCMHYSQPKEEYMEQFDQDYLPTWNELTAIAPRGKLRQHSFYYYNQAMNDWALTHWDWSDIQCEAKGKNLANSKLFDAHVALQNI